MTLTELMTKVGQLAFLLIVMLTVTRATYAVFRAVWDHESQKFETQAFDDTLIAAAKLFVLPAWKSKPVMVATVCAVVMIASMSVYSSTSFFESLGYATVCSAVVGVFTPFVLRLIKARATELSRVQKEDSSST